MAVVVVIVVAKSRDGGDKAFLVAITVAVGWSCHRRLRLSSTGLRLNPALDFLLLPAGHPLLRSRAATVFFFPLVVRIARIGVHAPIVVFSVEQNIMSA